MLLVGDTAPIRQALLRAVEDAGLGARIGVTEAFLPGVTAIGTLGDDDALDAAVDPGVDLSRLRDALIAANVPSVAAPHVATAIAEREDVLDVAKMGAPVSPDRPPTLFELAALRDVLGDELSALLPSAGVRIDRTLRAPPALNQCAMGDDGVARISLLSTNGTTLAGRTHALVHELGHALVGHARRAGRPYAASYGQPDYGRFLRPSSFDDPCDEEALVRAIADAWLLRRGSVAWARTWPGAVDDVARDLDGDDLAAFCRFRLAQGLGLSVAPVLVGRWNG